jgi:hypothetical protein
MNDRGRGLTSMLPPTLPIWHSDFLLISHISHAAASFTDACRFPIKWEGSWFQSGVRQPIVIEQSRLSTKGRCIASEGDKFVVVDE